MLWMDGQAEPNSWCIYANAGVEKKKRNDSFMGNFVTRKLNWNQC